MSTFFKIMSIVFLTSFILQIVKAIKHSSPFCDHYSEHILVLIWILTAFVWMYNYLKEE